MKTVIKTAIGGSAAILLGITGAVFVQETLREWDNRPNSDNHHEIVCVLGERGMSFVSWMLTHVPGSSRTTQTQVCAG